MPIRQRGNGWQVDVKHKGKRIRETVYGSRELAEAREAELRAILLGGRAVQADVPAKMNTLESCLDKTRPRWRGTKGESTALSNADMVLDFFGRDTLVQDLDAERVSEFIEHLTEQGNSNATINRKCSALRTVLTTAKDLEWIDRVPKIPRMKENKHRVVCFDDELIERMRCLLLEAGKRDLSCLVGFLADTGLRLGEARRLRWSEVSSSRVIVLDSKNGDDRQVPLTPRASNLVAAMPGKRPGPWHGLDYDRDIRRPWEAMKGALNRADDKTLVIHGLRHTFCSRLVQKGVHLQVVKELAGHRNIETTLRYAHLAPSNHEAAIAVLS